MNTVEAQPGWEGPKDDDLDGGAFPVPAKPADPGEDTDPTGEMERVVLPDPPPVEPAPSPRRRK